MPTSSTYITTGNPTGNVNSSLAANGYDKGDNNSLEVAIARVLTVNDDRSISYEIINNNFRQSSLGLNVNNDTQAYPLNNSIIKLPVVGELVRLIQGPEPFDTSNNPSQFSNTIYYESIPLSVWQDLNNNVVQNNNVIKSRSNSQASVLSYKQSSMGF